jgi:glyceraldehyde 3-phosphate dehydrogenase
MTKIAINGFGRIGRLAARIILDGFSDKLELVAVNTSGSMPVKDWVHLLQYDSAYLQFKKEVKVVDNGMVVGGRTVAIFGERDPVKIPWQKHRPDLVLECTGIFRKEKDARQLIAGSVKKVVLSAPAKEGNVPMFVLGVNDKDYSGEDLISCASCTTNCVAPVMKVLHKEIGVKKALLNTVHSYTSGQRLLDNSHKDLRRARSAAINIIPTSTGAAKATGKILKELEGVFDGLAIRVPTPTVSLADIVFVAAKSVSIEEVNSYLKKASQSELKGILQTSHKPLVSSDIVGDNHSSIVDLPLTTVVGGNLVRVVSWYDNEWGYTNRLVELALKIAS